jgi:hypothetical protein
MLSYFLSHISLKKTFVNTIIFLFFFLSVLRAKSQSPIYDLTVPPKNGFWARAEVVNGDTIPAMGFDTYVVKGKREFASKKKEKAYILLVLRVKKAYPVAKQAGDRYRKVLEEVKNLDEKARKARMKDLEDTLKAEYEPIIRKMSLNTGMILLKLIDRETGQSSYTLVKDLRGAFRAVFYQGLARMFGANLKTEYNPDNDNEDKMIEEIIGKIERGEE